MRDTKKQRRELEKQLTEASSYKHWLATATNLDELEGTLAWREEDGCELLHEALIRDHITAMKRCRGYCRKAFIATWVRLATLTSTPSPGAVPKFWSASSLMKWNVP
jgi:hypothetical protein